MNKNKNKNKKTQASIFGDLEGENALPVGQQESFYMYEIRHGKNQERRYIGISQEPERRLKEHKSKNLKKRAAWLREHPENVELIWCSNTETNDLREAEALEDAHVIAAMKNYGIENVRGGHYSQRNIGFVKRTLRDRGETV